jgi:branched-chain amino acid aminotransferase
MDINNPAVVNGQEVKNTIIYVNGQFVRKSDAKISVYDSGFQHGDGVYEGIRVYNNKIFMLKEHIQRLYESCKTLDIKLDIPQIELMKIVKKTVIKNLDAGFKNLHIRLQVTRGLKGMTGMNPKMNLTEYSLVICVDEKKPIFNSKGIKLITSTLLRFSPQYLDAKIHSCNQLNQIMAAIEANRQGADEAIMLDTNGFVAETNSTTLVLIKNSEFLLPKIDYILPGITRKILMKIAKDNQIPTLERNISISEFYNADEVFICGTVGEIVPVYEIDGRSISTETNNKFLEIFRKGYSKYIDQYASEI